MNKLSYSTIIFDLGGVLVDLNKERCIDAFKAIGYKDVDSVLGNYRQDGEFLALEEGRITTEQWRDFIREKIDRPVSDREIDDAFGAFLVDLPLKKLDMLRRLHEKYRIAMLSNTNQFMFEGKIREMFKSEGFEMEDYFDDIFVSYRMNLSKPSKDIFIEVASQLGIEPGEALFIDDSKANIDAAAKLGFGTMLVEPYADFSSTLLGLV